MTIWLAADVETTGVGNSDKIVELAYIAFDDTFTELFRGASLIDPEMPIPSGASAVNGITNKMVANEPTIEQFMRMNNDPLMVEDAVLVAHNARFDHRFLRPYMHETATTLCTLQVARKLWPELDSHKLQAIFYSQGLEPVAGNAHRAMADVEMLMNLVRKMMEFSGLDMCGLYELGKKEPIAKWPMGKHKNKPLNHDMGYVRWALREMTNMDPDLRAALEAVQS